MAKETPEELQYKEMVEGMAMNIARLSREVRALLSGRVQEKTIVLLLSHSCQLPQATVRSVLEALKSFEGTYLKK